MATNNNPVFSNIETTSGGLWRNIWTLTRCMKKAGWKYKGSGFSLFTLSTTSSPQVLPLSDINMYGSNPTVPTSGVFYVYSSDGLQTIEYTNWRYDSQFTGCTGGTGTIPAYAPVHVPFMAKIAAGSDGDTLPQATIDVNSTTGFPAAGSILVRTGAGFEEVTYTGTTATSFTGCAGGRGTMSLNGTVAAVRDITGDPALDVLGPGVSTGVTGRAIAISAPVQGRATVTGLEAMTAADKGRFLVISGSATPDNNHQHQIEEVVSATEVKIDARTFAVAADAGPLMWDVVDPMLDDRNWATVGLPWENYRVWWCAEGPAILKIPITQEPYGGTSAPLRGENIQQVASGFEGELLGYVWDYGGGNGYMVVSPRVRGTGGGRYGIGTGDITGDWSGFTVDAAFLGTELEFREQVVIYKALNSFQGAIFLGYFDVVNDSAEQYSTLALSSLAGFAPGSVPNSFPAHGYVLRGDSAGGVSEWTGQDTNRNYQNGLVICVDAIEEQNHSADGTWTWAVSDIYAHTAPTECWIVSYHRLNDVEDGEIHPYVGISNAYHGTAYAVGNRLNWHAHSGNVPPTSSFSANCWTAVYYQPFTAWIKRGLTGERQSDMGYAMLYLPFANGWPCRNYGTIPETLATVPNNVRVRNPIWVTYTNGSARYRKGTLRWLYFVQGGQRFDTSDTKTWIQLGCGYARWENDTNSYATLIHGCWDGFSDQLVMA